MPRYVYECEYCGKEAEELRLMSERDDPLDCPECDGAMERIVFPGTSRPQFRGSGFYETDYRDKS